MRPLSTLFALDKAADSISQERPLDSPLHSRLTSVDVDCPAQPIRLVATGRIKVGTINRLGAFSDAVFATATILLVPEDSGYLISHRGSQKDERPKGFERAPMPNPCLPHGIFRSAL